MVSSKSGISMAKVRPAVHKNTRKPAVKYNW
jgi:hypothetical protein